MIREGRMFGFALGLLATACWPRLCGQPPATTARKLANTTAAPLDIPHTTNLELTARANKKRAPGNIEKPEFLEPDSGLESPDLPEEHRRARANPHTRTAPARRSSAGSPPTFIATRTKKAGASKRIRARASTSSSTACT